MKTIYEAKEFIRSNLGKYVQIKAIGLRNKNEFIEGTISACYGHIFMVDTGFGQKSFTYSDVLIGNILVKDK